MERGIEVVEIKQKLTKQQFIEMFLLFMRQRTAAKLLQGFGFFAIGISVIIYWLDKETLINFFNIWGVIMIIGLRLGYYLHAHKVYKGEPTYQEMGIYSFDLDGFTMKGDSYFAERKWSDVHKVKEFDGWYFIYLNTQSFIGIDKQQLSEDTLKCLHGLFSKLSEVKTKLIHIS